jgi:hypothetical protein
MGLGSTRRLREMITRNPPGGKRRPPRGTDNLIATCEPIVWKMWEPRLLTNPWPPRPVTGTALLWGTDMNIVLLSCSVYYYSLKTETVNLSETSQTAAWIQVSGAICQKILFFIVTVVRSSIISEKYCYRGDVRVQLTGKSKVIPVLNLLSTRPCSCMG